VKTVEIRFRRVRSGPHPVPAPSYQSELAAGLDLCADIEKEVVLQPLERRAIPSGLALEIPPGYEGQVRPRSGLALKHGVTCLNSPGTIDADYRGEVQVILANLSNAPVTIQRGDRIAQLVISEACRAQLKEVVRLGPTARGEGGFGSTGGGT
jgi:dUTP pyrophosphatase